MIRTLSLISCAIVVSACGATSTSTQAPLASPDASTSGVEDARTAGAHDAAPDLPPPDAGQAPFDATSQPMPPPMMNMPDAGPPELSDGGIYRTPVTVDKVWCGDMTTCDTTMQHCCVSMTTGPQCVPTSRPTDTCGIVFDCDGPEDCAQGQSCCIQSTDAGPRVSCASSCAQQAAELCHRASDCPSERPLCCKGAAVPFGGLCKPMAAVMNGDECDVP